MQRNEFENYIAGLLNVAAFEDYAHNGLQIEGRPHVYRLATAVTASAAVIEAAVQYEVDALLVHHGLFWTKQPVHAIVGAQYRRIAPLIQNEINLFAYHLPLDAHPELGNNACLGKLLDLPPPQFTGDQQLVAYADLPTPLSPQAVAGWIETALNRKPTLFGAMKEIKRIAWCTGAAENFLDTAHAVGADLFLTGEASERSFHAANETGMAFIAAGHHATERGGVRALGDHLAEYFGIIHHFIDEPNPL